MPEAFDPNGLDIEAQLRRYADHVEAQVGEPTLRSADRSPSSERRWPIYLAVAAALLLVVGLASVLLADDEEGSDPADDPDVIAEDDEEPEPEPDPEDAEEPDEDAELDPVYDRSFPEAPIAPRADAVVVGSSTHVLVWGGSGTTGERLNDGAVFDLATEQWTVLDDAPFDDVPASWDALYSGRLDAFVVAVNNEVALLDPETAAWDMLERAPIPVGELLVDDLLVVSNGATATTLDLRRDEAVWTDPFFVGEVDPALASSGEVEWGIRGDELVAVDRWGAEGLAVVTFSAPAALAGTVVDRYDWQDLAAGQAATRGFAATLVGSDGRLLVVHEGGGLVSWSADFSDRTELRLRAPVDPRGTADPRIDAVGEEALIRLPGAVIHADRARATASYSNAFVGSASVSSGPNGPTLWVFGSDTVGQPGTQLDGSEALAPRGEQLPVLVGTAVLFLEEGETVVSWTVGDFDERIVLETPVGGCSASYVFSQESDDQRPVVQFEDGTLAAGCEGTDTSRLLDRAAHVSLFQEPGPDAVAVPAVTQLFADSAMATVRAAGLEPIIQFELVPSGSANVGRIISQEPAPFETLPLGSEVILVVGESSPDAEPDSSRTIPSTTIPMCSALDPVPTAVSAGPIRLGDAWPVLEDDVLLSSDTAVIALNDGEVRGAVLIGDVVTPAHADGAGGLVVQTPSGLVHVAASGSLATLRADANGLDFPGYVLHGTAEIDAEWVAFATLAPQDPFEIGEGDLVLVPLNGGPDRVVGQVMQEEGGARPDFDGENFILRWGSLGETWVRGVDLGGEAVDLPWNSYETPAFLEDELIIGAHGWQVYTGLFDPSTGVLQLSGFDGSRGDLVFPLGAVHLGPGVTNLSILPLEDRVFVSADTPDGPCTRVVLGDGEFTDVPFRGRATGPVRLYGVGD